MEKSYRRHDISDRMCVLGVIKTKVILLVVLVFLSLALFETQMAQAGTSKRIDEGPHQLYEQTGSSKPRFCNVLTRAHINYMSKRDLQSQGFVSWKNLIDGTIFLIALECFRATSPRKSRELGRSCPRQSPIHKCDFLDFSHLALPGETCRLITEIGKIHTDAFVAGGIRGFGNLFLKSWSMILILNG